MNNPTLDEIVNLWVIELGNTGQRLKIAWTKEQMQMIGNDPKHLAKVLRVKMQVAIASIEATYGD